VGAATGLISEGGLAPDEGLQVVPDGDVLDVVGVQEHVRVLGHDDAVLAVDDEGRAPAYGALAQLNGFLAEDEVVVGLIARCPEAEDAQDNEAVGDAGHRRVRERRPQVDPEPNRGRELVDALLQPHYREHDVREVRHRVNGRLVLDLEVQLDPHLTLHRDAELLWTVKGKLSLSTGITSLNSPRRVE
jgi:hypothetical protein